MPTLTDIHGKIWPKPDPSSLTSALSQIKGASETNSATLKLDTGEYVILRPNLDATFGDGRSWPITLQFSTWEDVSTVCLKLLKGDVPAVREIFDPSPAAPPQTAPKCLQCGVAMDVGFVPHRSQRGLESSIWYPGIPQDGFFGNVKLPAEGQPYHVTAYRCPTCGRVECYAWQKA